MIPIPKSIQVGPYTYRVDTDPWEFNRICHRDSEYMYGETDPRSQTILLDGTLGLTQMQTTLAHEVEHCINNLAAVGKHLDLSEEEYIERTSDLRVDVYKRNPLFVSYLMQQESPE